jgi:hypothetical protein
MNRHDAERPAFEGHVAESVRGDLVGKFLRT